MNTKLQKFTNTIITEEWIKNKIHTFRWIQVMLDRDLALLFWVEVKVLNQAVKRNLDRFPEDFMFQLVIEEYEEFLRSQNVTLKQWRWQHRKYLPYVFTEQWVSMLSAVLKSKVAINISLEIIRAFVKMRKILQENAWLFQRIDNIEYKLLEHNKNFDKIFKAIENKDIKPVQWIFYNWQIYDAYKFINDLLKSTQKEIILVDNYIDDTVLTLFSKYKGLKFKIITKNISKQLQLDINKYNSQYKNLEIKISNKFHDRFLILDKQEVYHLGSSLKDLWKKIFWFNKIDIELLKNYL